MGSQKGYTAIEAVIWFCAATACILAVIGAMAIYGWAFSDTSGPVAPTPETITTTPLPMVPRHQKVVPNQIVAVECSAFDCGAALKVFEREYRDCNVIPIGPYSMDGQTVLYYFLVSSAVR